MIYISGDIHGNVNALSNGNLKYLQHKFTDEDYIIVCGDFGVIWDNGMTQKFYLEWLEEKPFTTLFVTGNHENYDLLEQYPVCEWNGGKVHKINDKVFHLMNGQVFDISGYRFFTMGGAESHDISDGILEPDDPDFRKKFKDLNEKRALFRVNHYSWWKQEIPSAEEMEEGLRNLDRVGWKVDVVITHCAPTSINEWCDSTFYPRNILTDYLETVSDKLDFRKWFFGHYHRDVEFGDEFRMLYAWVVSLDAELHDTENETVRNKDSQNGGNGHDSE